MCESICALLHVCSGAATASLTIGACVRSECEIHLWSDDCFSHASNEPKRPPATGGVCVCVSVTQYLRVETGSPGVNLTLRSHTL